MLAGFYRSIAVLIIFCAYTSTASAFQCLQVTGTCEPISDGSQGGSPYCQTKDSKIYCSYFQCDGNGEVKLNDSSGLNYRPPGLFVGGGMYNIAGVVTVNRNNSQIVCYSNCCYRKNSECQEFVGQINSVPSCQNLCCPTLQGYVNGDCSNSCTPTNSPGEGLVEDPIGDSPLFGDLDGGGKL